MSGEKKKVFNSDSTKDKSNYYSFKIFAQF